MDPENLFLNGSELNVEKLIKEKKTAKVYIILSILAMFAGFSASLVFFIKYDLILTPTFALISSLIALSAFYIYIQFLRDVWQIWTYQLKYWYLFAGILQIASAACFVAFIVMAIYYKQPLEAKSYYVTSVWSFMCWKWSFIVFTSSKKLRNMFTRYSLIGDDDADEISE